MSDLAPISLGRADRLPELDIYRGLALVLMVLIHNMYTWTPVALRQWPGPWEVGDLYFGMSASLFFSASGATLFVSLRRRRASGARPIELLQHVGSRLFLLYAIGIAFEQVWYAPPYDVTFFAELNTIAFIGVLALLFVLWNRGFVFPTALMVWMVSAFFVLRYGLQLGSLDSGVYVISPFWSGAPSIQFTAAYPFAKLALEFGYSFLIWGSFGILGVILSKQLLDHKIGFRLLMFAFGLVAAGYFVQVVLGDPFRKFPVSMSYFLLAEGFTILVFFIARALSSVPARFVPFVAAPFTAAGRYALPLYFAHYLLIFASEATGIAAGVRGMSSDLAPFVVVLVLAAVVGGFLAIAMVADRFRFGFPKVHISPNATKRLLVAGIAASTIVAYLAVAGSMYSLIGLGPENPMAFLVIGTTIPVLWYVAYKAVA